MHVATELQALRDLLAPDADDEAFFEHAFSEIESAIQSLEGMSQLAGPQDHLACCLEFRARDADGLRLIVWKFEAILKDNALDIQELSESWREAAWEVTGAFAYGHLKHLAGPHRIEYEDNQGRKRKEMVDVGVIPLLQETVGYEVDSRTMKIEEIDEIRRAVFGSIVHRRAVRLTHLPTGIVVIVEGLPKLYLCRQKALQILESKLLAIGWSELPTP